MVSIRLFFDVVDVLERLFDVCMRLLGRSYFCFLYLLLNS